MANTKPFFYICVGLTLSLPLFYLDLAVVEFFEKGRATYESSGSTASRNDFKSDELDMRKNLRATPAQPPPSQLTPASGQHLLLDLQGGSFEKLNDEDYLREAVLSIIDKANMHLLGIQSAKLNPHGVSVVAMLAESHLSIHTWPEHGSALVDLFTCGEGTKLHTQLDNVIEAFTGNLTASTYSIIPRGTFTEKFKALNDPQFQPVEIMTSHKYKNKIVEVQSPYQNIAIYDHHDTQEDDFEINVIRSLYLDGVIQSNVYDEEKYHESLVHPAFMASPVPPKRVLIVGGGEGGTLRESLKYSSVERVTMVDLDAKVIELSRKYLASYSNCTGFGTPSCFDDPRADLYAEDFFEWFEKHIGHDICDTRREKAGMLYDVIILDLLDPESLPEGAAFAEYLYSEKFFRRISCTLTDRGVLVSNFGEGPEAPFMGGPEAGLQHELFKERAAMFYDKAEKIRNLSRNFHHTRVYDTAVPSYRADWAFAIGMVPRLPGSKLSQADIKENVANFDASTSVINRKLKERMLVGASTKYYEGSIHHGFQYPRSDWKGVFCFHNREDCKDPLSMFRKMDSYDRSCWHPVFDNIRTDIAESLETS